MRRLVATLALVAILALVPVGVCFGEEGGVEAAEEAVDTQAGDLVDDWYGQLNLRSGFLWNVEAQKFVGYATFPIAGYRAVALEGGVEIDPEIEDGPTAMILGVTYNLGNLRDWGIEVPFAEHFGVNVGPVLRYDFDTREKELAFIVSLVDLSLDDGNVKRQRTR